jgi:hypothetical protein
MSKHRLVRALALVLLAPLVTAAQDDATRTIVPDAFIKARPASPSKPAGGGPTYRRVTPARPPAANAQAAEIGLTIWKLRPAAAGDAARLLVQEPQASTEWTPQRVDVGTPLALGDRLRITVESPRAGYLYVVDRERYADGTTSDPYLIFPTARTRGGDNRVVPGRLIDVSAQTDGPPYFTVQASRADQVGELITVIVTRDPLGDVTPGPAPLLLKREMVADWEKRGGTVLEQLEMVGGAGKAWSVAEQRAGADATRLLTQQDPPPQTLFRVVTTEPAIIAAQFTLRHTRARGGSAPVANPSTRQPAR